MRVLMIGAHPDDEVLGVGGTLAKHAAKGDEVYVSLLCEHVHARKNKPQHALLLEQIHAAKKTLGVKDILFFDFPNIQMNTVPTLHMVQAIEKAIVEVKPEVIYTHHRGDVNDDHRVVSEATMAAMRLPERGTIPGIPRDMIKRVLCYPAPSSTDWAPPYPDKAFIPNVFVDINGFLETKLKALECYGDNVMRDYPHPRSIEAVTAQAKVYGVQSGLGLAEAFVLIRE
ncbi:MAG: PIG-L deacetylase family protein, partial [Deltaproteobacteria bacterium]|nr:PIG-L deacetylase family protein [Deltaproteobacteria bacterium]